MEFWIIMIAFIALGGTCSLAGTWKGGIGNV